jgi:hypothetical protein
VHRPSRYASILARIILDQEVFKVSSDGTYGEQTTKILKEILEELKRTNTSIENIALDVQSLAQCVNSSFTSVSVSTT